MSNLFSDLEKVTAEQKSVLAGGKPTKAKKKREEERGSTQYSTQRATQYPTRKVTHLLKDLNTEEIEKFAFDLRKKPKVRVNADVPAEWKDQLDSLAHQLKVGKYELLLYMIAFSLGKVQREETS